MGGVAELVAVVGEFAASTEGGSSSSGKVQVNSTTIKLEKGISRCYVPPNILIPILHFVFQI